jgi:hypothetical protein
MELNKLLIYFFAFVILYNIYLYIYPIREGMKGANCKDKMCENNKIVSVKDKIHSLEKKLQSMETNVEENTSQIKTNTDNIKEFAEASKKQAQEQTGLTDDDASKPAPQVSGIE